MIITNNIYQKLEVKPMENDAIAICEANRSNAMDSWNTKVLILNRREALGIYQTISDIVLSPVK